METAGLPPGVVLPDPQHVADALASLGYPTRVFTHPQTGPFHTMPGPPDWAWLMALRMAGMRPVPCLGCYSDGEGDECMAGRCARRPTPTRG